jgi:hypothetical protein
MCFSFGASLAAFIIDVIGAVLLYTITVKNKKLANDNKVYALLLIGLATMQLGELFIHSDLKCTSSLNAFGSHLAYFSLLFLQPFFAGLGIIYYGVGRPNEPYEGCSCTRSCLKNKSWIPFIWSVIFVIYAIMAADVGYEIDLYYSTSLDKNVSKWCTSDFFCDGFGCPLLWNWDDLNQGTRYILYFLLILGFPILSLEFWEFWASMLLLFLIAMSATSQPIFRLGAACLWGPIISCVFQLCSLPILFREKFIKKCFAKCQIYDNPQKWSISSANNIKSSKLYL